jgi:Domain of unknown function (DUF4338)
VKKQDKNRADSRAPDKKKLDEEMLRNGEEVAKILSRGDRAKRSLWLCPIEGSLARQCFDHALDRLHYARSCQRVGRCMRLAIMLRKQWVGGIVLGSTFPNVGVRDEALGLKLFVRGFQHRGLRNAWCKENVEYWSALQSIVNHARTFVFPDFQGRGIAKAAHALLLTQGMQIWEKRYRGRVYALDTLCDQTDSGLFVANGWTLVGQTKGYTADYGNGFSADRNGAVSINNAALKFGRTRWQVWVRVIRPSLRPRSSQ